MGIYWKNHHLIKIKINLLEDARIYYLLFYLFIYCCQVSMFVELHIIKLKNS